MSTCYFKWHNRNLKTFLCVNCLFTSFSSVRLFLFKLVNCIYLNIMTFSLCQNRLYEPCLLWRFTFFKLIYCLRIKTTLTFQNYHLKTGAVYAFYYNLLPNLILNG